jgi:hypothetical protein
MFRRRDQRMDASQEDPQEPGHVEGPYEVDNFVRSSIQRGPGNPQGRRPREGHSSFANGLSARVTFVRSNGKESSEWQRYLY